MAEGRNYVKSLDQESLFLAKVTKTTRWQPTKYDYVIGRHIATGPAEERTTVSLYGPYNTPQAAQNVASGHAKGRYREEVLESRIEILETKLDWTTVRDTMVIERNTNKEELTT